MASFACENNVNSGVEAMDAQRHKIFDCMSTICNLIADTHHNSDSIGGLLDQLEILCQIHYMDEEQLMEGVNYPLAAEHKRQHDLFLVTIDQFKIDNKQCHTTSMLNDFINIREDFITHMLNETMLLSEFINKISNGDSATAAH